MWHIYKAKIVNRTNYFLSVNPLAFSSPFSCLAYFFSLCWWPHIIKYVLTYPAGPAMNISCLESVTEARITGERVGGLQSVPLLRATHFMFYELGIRATDSSLIFTVIFYTKQYINFLKGRQSQFNCAIVAKNTSL